MRIGPTPLVTAAVVALLLVPAARAQERAAVELAPFAGYRFGGAVTDAYSGASASLHDAGAFGLTVDIPFRRGTDVEVLVSRQDTGVDLERYPEIVRYDLTIDHWMAGVRGAITTQDPRIRPFIAVYVGFTHFSGASGEVTADTRFAVALGGGAVFGLSRSVGIRLDARAYASFVESGAGLFCGGGGCSGSFGGTAMLQGEVAAALVVRL